MPHSNTYVSENKKMTSPLEDVNRAIRLRRLIRDMQQELDYLETADTPLSAEPELHTREDN